MAVNRHASRPDVSLRAQGRPGEGCTVRSNSPLRLLVLTFALVAGFAAAGQAEDAQANKQQAAPPPVPDRGTTSQTNCIDQNNEYTKVGTRFFYVQTFENKCEARIKCAVFTNVVQAKGSTLGHSTVILGPKSQGPAAKKSYSLRIKGLGGMSSSERECRVL
jgi:hypothetical protein